MKKVIIGLAIVGMLSGCTGAWEDNATYSEIRILKSLEARSINSCWKAKNVRAAIESRATRPLKGWCDLRRAIDKSKLNFCDVNNKEVEVLFEEMQGEDLDSFCNVNTPIFEVSTDPTTTEVSTKDIISVYDELLQAIPLCGRSKFKINLMIEQKGGLSNVTQADVNAIVLSCKVYEVEKALQEEQGEK